MPPLQDPLTDTERLLGYTTLKLIGDWPAWVRRRVVTASYETATTLRRRVSVDLRLHETLFGEPHVKLGSDREDRFHYVPIARLRKQRLLRFDVRDEQDTALPLVSRRRNARIGAATLTALAQTLMHSRLKQDGWPHADTIDSSLIGVPPEIEERFWQLCNLDYRGDATDPNDAAYVFHALVAGSPSTTARPSEWTWAERRGRYWANVDHLSWIAKLVGDPQFAALAASFEQNFLVCVPLRGNAEGRRIIKYSYSEAFAESETKAITWLRGLSGRIRLAGLIDRIEDRIEGLPRVGGAKIEWIGSVGPEEPLSLRTRVTRGIGWRCKALRIDAAGVGDTASYHLELELPAGIQVRRAHLTLSHGAERLNSTPVLRGVRDVERVHMYATAPQGTTASALVHVRPQSRVIVRGAVLCAVLAAIVLTLMARYGASISGGANDQTEAMAAILVLVPGVLAAYVARGDEHPLATSLLVGVRVVALVPGLLTLIGAGLFVFDHTDTWAGTATAAGAWLTLVVLGVTWRLGGRGRPDDSVELR